MKANFLIAASGLFTRTHAGLLRFGCAQLTVQRLDPLVNPGANPSPHLHQIIGGNSFNVTMDPQKGHDLAKLSTCTTCEMVEDFSNYWTATIYFKARNGSYHRVPQRAQQGIETTNGGMMVYYMTDALFSTTQSSPVTAFKPGFRMLVGSVSNTDREGARDFRQLTYIYMQNEGTREPETLTFPRQACPMGIMINHRFPTCWDGVNLDSPDHREHVRYPESGTFESGGPCPSSHPIRLPQILLETVWDTRSFNNPADWPTDGSQPFTWSSGDALGWGTHADYVFGWKDDSLQKAMDSNSYVNAPTLKKQNIPVQNKCNVKDMVGEKLDGWFDTLPGGMRP